jgi:hypothetical protein
VAWDWKVNVDKGVDLFVEKLSIARSHESKIRKSHTGLRALDGKENEDMALVLYGPYSTPDLGKQYYIPFCDGGTISGTECQGGTWQWQENTAGNSDGVTYAKSVRKKIVP